MPDCLEDLLTELRRRAASLPADGPTGRRGLSLVRPADAAEVEESLPEQERPDLGTSA